jgi:3-hydroxybutyryl-CoA dehydratase
MDRANRLRYEDISVGSEYSFTRTLTEQDVHAFATLTGDHNPLHVDKSFARRSTFTRPIAHGMLAASLFSTLVGMHCPGERCLYLSQSAQFKTPIYPGDTVTVKGTVTAKSDSMKMIILKTQVLCGGRVMIDGEAKARVLE